MTDWWFDNEILISQICVFMIAAASLQITLNAGVFSLLSGATWLLGAYTAAITVREGGPAVLAMLAAVVIGSAVAGLLSLVLRRLSGTAMAMATLALALIVGVAIRSGGEFTGGALGIIGIPVSVSAVGAIGLAVAVAVLLSFVQRGRLGRAVAVVREDPHVAASVGIPVRRARHATMFLSGALAGLSGSMYALMFNIITPSQGGFTFIVLLLSMVVIGGVRSWRGAYLGAAILTWLPDLSDIANTWNGVFYGALLILIVVYAPEGLMGLARTTYKWVRVRLRNRPSPAAPARAAADA